MRLRIYMISCCIVICTIFLISAWLFSKESFDSIPAIEDEDKSEYIIHRSEQVPREDITSFIVHNGKIYIFYDEAALVNVYDTDGSFEYSMGRHVFPDDPEFYREDGSILFDSIIHEGECSIYPRESEDISDVLQTGTWLRMDENGYPDVPASEWQYPLSEATEMLEDPLYKKLVAIMEKPESYLIQFTADEIVKIVNDYRPPFLKLVELPIPGASCLPHWYYAFEMFVLGKCNANTNVHIPKALADAGHEDEEGFKRYFELLQEYADMVAGKSK